VDVLDASGVPDQTQLLPDWSDPQPRHTLTFLQAAERVLQDSTERTPMHFREITRRAIEGGLITTAGHTPEATMYAQIITDIERSHRRGELPRFVRHGRGLVSLKTWEPLGLAGEINAHNRDSKAVAQAPALSTAARVRRRGGTAPREAWLRSRNHHADE
jgi:restriction system protein